MLPVLVKTKKQLILLFKKMSMFHPCTKTPCFSCADGQGHGLCLGLLYFMQLSLWTIFTLDFAFVNGQTTEEFSAPAGRGPVAAGGGTTTEEDNFRSGAVSLLSNDRTTSTTKTNPASSSNMNANTSSNRNRMNSTSTTTNKKTDGTRTDSEDTMKKNKKFQQFFEDLKLEDRKKLDVFLKQLDKRLDIQDEKI